MYISRLHKLAGKREEKKVSGLNFSELQKKLLSQGLPADPPTIKEMLSDEVNLSISKRKRELISKLEFSEDGRRRVNEVEAALIIIGAVLKDESKAEEFISDFNWHLTTLELSPGSFGISAESISSPSSIMDEFEKIYKIVLDEKESADEKAEESKEELYFSDKKIKDLSDGWRVVYVPAVGESGMPEYPGLPETSHDRILEGNKNGLCLGSNLKYYQNNSEGEIYSVRDPSNKPRVTIRILDNVLAEAKGKNNLPPDVEGAKKADEWFKTIDGLKYKDIYDYVHFPPFTIEMAKGEFKTNKISAYEKEWVPYWYKKGIEELDLDLESKIKENDIILIIKNFGKYTLLYEKIKPVVAYWCNKYILNKDYSLENILFSNYNQIWKTYKKLKEMQLAVKVYSDKHPYKFLQSNIKNIQEYNSSMESAAKLAAEKYSYEFLDSFKQEPWAQPYLYEAAKLAAEKKSNDFLYNFRKKPWAQPYLDLAAKIAVENNSIEFLFRYVRESWSKPYVDRAVMLSLKENSNEFLRLFHNEPWAQSYIDLAAKLAIEKSATLFLFNFENKPWAQPYIDEAIKLAAEKSSYFFLHNFSDKPWAQPYIDMAAKIAAENNSTRFIAAFGNTDWVTDWANKPIESIGGMTWLEYAKSMEKKSGNNYKDSLIKLSNILIKMNLEKFSLDVKKLL
jgi:hypothetical protein